MSATLSIDALIVGSLFIMFLFAVFEYVKKRIAISERVWDTKTNIHSNALWDYDNKNRKETKEEYEPSFEGKLDDEATKEYFKTRGK